MFFLNYTNNHDSWFFYIQRQLVYILHNKTVFTFKESLVAIFRCSPEVW